MKRTALILFIILSGFLSLAAKPTLRQQIEKAAENQPRLFLKANEEKSLRKKVEANPHFNKIYDHVIQSADHLIDLPPLERKKIGRRMLGTARNSLARICNLAFAYRMTGNKKYAKRAETEMLSAAGFSSWNPSHFLDTAEMTAGLAIGYDWCYDALNTKSRKTIKTAILEKGLNPSLEKDHWWIDFNNNWNQVCHGGLVLGAIAIMDEEPEIAEKIIQRMLDNIHHATDEYKPDGAYPEGPTYWFYGTVYNLYIITALESAFGHDFGLSATAGFLESSDYSLHSAGPNRVFFNYADSGRSGGLSPIHYWFAKKRNKPSLLWRNQKLIADYANSLKKHKASKSLPFLLMWVDHSEKAPMPKRNHWTGNGPNPVSFHRSEWGNPDAIFFGIKGGSPAESHAHMDIGSFVIDADGVRWAEDLGPQSYHQLESMGIDLWNRKQESDRWDVFRLNNFSHNTLVVDGQKQIADSFSPIISFSDNNQNPHTIIDMVDAYKGQLAASKRGMKMYQNKTIVVQDEIKTLDRKTNIRWGMLTRADIDIKGSQAVLKQDGKTLFAQIISPKNTTFETYETENPPKAHDAKNPGTKMLGFNVDVPAKSETVFIVEFKTQEDFPSPEAVTLEKWREKKTIARKWKH